MIIEGRKMGGDDDGDVNPSMKVIFRQYYKQLISYRFVKREPNEEETRIEK